MQLKYPNLLKENVERVAGTLGADVLHDVWVPWKQGACKGGQTVERLIVPGMGQLRSVCWMLPALCAFCCLRFLERGVLASG